MRKLKLLCTALKINGVSKVLISFLIYLLLTALAIMLIDPEIHNYLDALWYCFSVISTIGFGDIIVTSIISKILTIILSFYAIITFAILTATVVNYFSELQKAKYNDSMLEFMHQLEHLDTLSKEELKELSKKISEYKLKKEYHKK
ncbi:MAG: potassium channel family protein [Acutalibacteraceae bacterium]|nr:potassium channel family protein [Acutalibacteraceae bacterium]